MTAIANYRICKKYFGRNVIIKARNGSTYIGKIVKLSKNKLQLKVSSVQHGNKLHTSFFPFILPLVLFDLLVIALLV